MENLLIGCSTPLHGTIFLNLNDRHSVKGIDTEFVAYGYESKHLGVSGLWLQVEFIHVFEMTHIVYCFSRSSVKFPGHTGQKINDIDPNWAIRSVTQAWIHPWLWLQFEFTDGFKMMHKACCSKEEVPCSFPMSSIKFQGHTGQKNHRIERFRAVTPVWIHPRLWNDAQCLT